MILINKESKTKLTVKKVTLSGINSNGIEFVNEDGEVEELLFKDILDNFNDKQVSITMTGIEPKTGD